MWKLLPLPASTLHTRITFAAQIASCEIYLKITIQMRHQFERENKHNRYLKNTDKMYTLDIIVITMNMLTDIPSGVHIPAHNIQSM